MKTNEPMRCAILYDGVRYSLQKGLTLLSALEEAGMRFVRGIGCRGGVCGACTALYRFQGDDELHVALICQAVVEDGMEVLPLPYFPQKKITDFLDLPNDETPGYRVLTLYPEVTRCIMCGECSRVCPVDIDVMGYVGRIKRGDLRGAAQDSFVCIQCQACVLRCPAQISQPNAALAARRLYGRHEAPRADHLTRAIERQRSDVYRRTFRRLRRMSREELQVLYQRREREPDEAPPGTWMPEDRLLLPQESRGERGVRNCLTISDYI